MPMYPGKNNSKKISELKPRDVITYHRDHTWIPIAQYDSRIDSYTNLAINLSAITDYTDSYAYYLVSQISGSVADEYDLKKWLYLKAIGETENPGYITPELNNLVTYSSIAQNLITYAFSYTDMLHGWEYLFGHYDVDIPNRPEYLYTDLERYILTQDGRKIMIDNG